MTEARISIHTQEILPPEKEEETVEEERKNVLNTDLSGLYLDFSEGVHWLHFTCNPL